MPLRLWSNEYCAFVADIKCLHHDWYARVYEANWQLLQLFQYDHLTNNVIPVAVIMTAMESQ